MDQIAETTKALEDTRQLTKDALTGVDDETFNRQPSEQQWSMRQVTEHLAATESQLAFAITRTRGMEWPHGRLEPSFATAKEALACLSETRKRLLDSLHGLDPTEYTVEHEGRQGPYSIASLVEIQIHHDEDHSQQLGSLR